VEEIDPRLASALAEQLEAWRATMRGGATRVGWKLGLGEGERIGRGPVVGHLTSATELKPGSTFRAGVSAVALHADAEIGLELGKDVDPDASRDTALAALAGYGAALELVDLGGPVGGPEDVVAANVYHRAFALGPLNRSWPLSDVEASLIINGERRASSAALQDIAYLVCSVAALLGGMGERLQAGDRMIMGSIVQVPIATGDEVIAELGALGRVQLTVEL
jgi:2-keto-4-pentenoate hydratase